MRLLICYMLRLLITAVVVAYCIVAVIVVVVGLYIALFPQHCCRLLAILLLLLLLRCIHTSLESRACVYVCVCVRALSFVFLRFITLGYTSYWVLLASC